MSRAAMPIPVVMTANAQASTLPLSGPKLDKRRVLAALVDLVIVGAGAAVILAAAGALGAGERSSALTVVILGWALYYYFACEASGGQTAGKKLLSLRVLGLDGRPAGMREVALRTVLRVVDGIGLYVVGLIVMLVTGERRGRLGDLAAGTIVADASAATRTAPEAAGSDLDVTAPEAASANITLPGQPAPAAPVPAPAPTVVEPAPAQAAPVAEPETIAEPETVAEPGPVAEPEPVIVYQPVAVPEPVAEPEPAPTVVESESIPTVAVPEPASTVEPEPAPTVPTPRPFDLTPAVQAEPSLEEPSEEPSFEEPALEEPSSEQPPYEQPALERPAPEQPDPEPASDIVSDTLRELARDVAEASAARARQRAVAEQPAEDEPVTVKSVETVSAIDLIMGAGEDEGTPPAPKPPQA